MPTRALRVHALTRSDLPSAVALATHSLESILRQPGTFSPDILREHLTPFLESRISMDRAIGIVRADGSLAGYAAYDRFPFHGEETAFLPVLAHAAAPDARADITEQLYTALAAKWAADGIRKHLIAVPPAHSDVEHRLFEIGFGRYVTVAMRVLAGSSAERPGADVAPLRRSGPPEQDRPLRENHRSGVVTIRRATESDVPGLARLCAESVRWYAASPIFLRFASDDPAELAALVRGPDSAVFVAEDEHELAGFMGISVVREPLVVDCVAEGAATLDGIGAYLTELSRGRGLGILLLEACEQWAREHSCSAIHVDFESANPAARAFWPRYFEPSVHSLMRVIHPDAV